MFKVINNLFINHIYKPTPIVWRLIGDAILYGCQGGAIIEICRENHATAIIFAVISMAGKFLSNYPVSKNV